ADLAKPAVSSKFDYEGELGIVIGAGGRYIRAEKALDAIAGFVVLNDASCRDWQRAASQWTAGKNFAGSMPIGPEVVTTDEVDVSDLAISSTLNGTVMQSARTSQMLVSVPAAVEFFSSFTHLAPGDVIATGTPGGVGFARTPPVWLEPGDLIEVTVEKVGTIRNRVVAEKDAPTDWRGRPAPRRPPPGSPRPRARPPRLAPGPPTPQGGPRTPPPPRRGPRPALAHIPARGARTRRRRRARPAAAAAAAASVLALAACGSSGGTTSGASPSAGAK